MGPADAVDAVTRIGAGGCIMVIASGRISIIFPARLAQLRKVQDNSQQRPKCTFIVRANGRWARPPGRHLNRPRKNLPISHDPM
jgi:hypothetical protein